MRLEARRLELTSALQLSSSVTQERSLYLSLFISYNHHLPSRAVIRLDVII